MAVLEWIAMANVKYASETGKKPTVMYVGSGVWGKLCGELGVSGLACSLVYDGLTVYRVNDGDHNSAEHLTVAHKIEL